MRNKKRNGGDRESDQDCYHHKASDQTFSLGSLWAHILSGLTLKVSYGSREADSVSSTVWFGDHLH
jgi:hypothetical protein